MKRRPSSFIMVLAVLTLAGCAAHKASLLNPDDKAFSKRAPAHFYVLFVTTRGNLTMEVTRDWAPYGVDRFYNLVRYGYFDNSPVWRIRKGTWAQFGISGDPNISQAWRNKNIPDDPRKVENVRGTVAYAFKDPNGRTTQVFINLKDNRATHDQEPFVPFAKVVEGMEVADAWYDGYGERAGGGIRGGKQDVIFERGNEYWKKNFPLLDYIIRARIVK